MSTPDEIDSISGIERERLLHGEWQSDPAGYVRKLARSIDPRDRDDRRAKLLKQRAELERLYTDNIVFRVFVDQRAAEIATHPGTVIIDLMRSGFAVLVLDMGTALAGAHAELVRLATEGTKISISVPAEYATSERSPDWLRDLITDAKRDQEAGAE